MLTLGDFHVSASHGMTTAPDTLLLRDELTRDGCRPQQIVRVQTVDGQKLIGITVRTELPQCCPL